MKTRILIVILILAIAGLVATHDPPMRRAHAQDTGAIILSSGWNISSVSSGNTVFASNVVAKQAGSVLRIAVVLGSAAPFSIKEFGSDGTNFTSYFNGGTALSAGCMYTFVWESRCKTAIGGSNPGPLSFNFVVSSPTTVPILRVTECVGGVD